MAYDVLIKNARICDGTGAAAFSGAVAVREGKIVEVGKVSGAATREINADGLILAPGFVDHHTHYDAQISWDPLLTSSCWHGITSVVMGNCGVGVAPCRADERGIVAWDLVNVEAMPYEVLLNGVTWAWESFPEYLAAIGKRPLGMNAGFLVPLSALRFFVLGEAASERAARPEEIEQMTDLLRQAMRAGAFGFSLSMLRQHIGYHGRPLSSRLASREELAALASVLREVGYGVIELALTRTAGALAEDELELLKLLAERSGRPITWLALVDRTDMPYVYRDALRTVAPYIEGGMRIHPQVTPRPARAYHNLRTPFLFASYASWKDAFNRSPEEQVALYNTPEFREAFRQELKGKGGVVFTGQWDRVSVVKVTRPAHQRFLNQSVAEVAAQTGKDPVDALLDLVVAENLEAGLLFAATNTNPDAVQELITNPYVLIGLSDAGAHVDQSCNAGVPTYLLHEWVHKRKVMSVEEGVRRLTSEPANFLGLKKKGRIAQGMDADLVLFDLDTVKPCPLEWVNDLPGGKPRLIERAEGVAYTLVSGEIFFAHGEHQGVYPGQVMRSFAV
jgi:N-acyl-D-amino-acid deacylase